MNMAYTDPSTNGSPIKGGRTEISTYHSPPSATAPSNPLVSASPPVGQTDNMSPEKIIVGLTMGILVALIIGRCIVHIILVKRRKKNAKIDEEAGADTKGGGQSDPDVVSPAPPQYSEQDLGIEEVPKYELDSKKEMSGESEEKVHEKNEKTASKEKAKHARGSPSPVGGIRVLV
ncbi:hypothetical protein ABW20_dc0106939 [Dactylellina cionopaga]|nr:hypothetical protein ABW20_dc0106939 [Dactylellina cionopaga]